MSNTVNVADVGEVSKAVCQILAKRFPNRDLARIQTAFLDCEILYRGDWPGYYGCDTPYHNLQHILDVTLAAVRLMDGAEMRHSENPMGWERVESGVIVALLHDCGYIRKRGDTVHFHGAEYTKVHVSRGASFLADYLPRIELGSLVELAQNWIHYTGYEHSFESLDEGNELNNRMGFIIGTADLIAQMSDRIYLEKCRDYLFEEFELAGLTKRKDANGKEVSVIDSAEDLVKQTPTFIEQVFKNRLDGVFKKAYTYEADHFGGKTLYLDAIRKTAEFARKIAESDDLSLLRRNSLQD